MGATNSTTMKNTTTTNVINDFMQSINTELQTTNSAEVDLSQELQFNMPNASIDGCNIDISQTQTGTLNATLDALANITDEQEAELITEITNAQEQALTQANEDLAVGMDNEADTENEINTNVENSLTMSIEKVFQNMNYVEASGTQKAQIDLMGLMCIDSDIVIDQDQQISIVAENLSETISDTVQDGDAVTTIVNLQTQSVKQTNTGMGMASSGSSSSSILSIILSAVGGAMMSSGKGGEDGDGGKPGGMSGKLGKRGGGKDITISEDIAPSEGINWVLVIGIVVIGLVVLAVISYILYIYTPEFPCPTEEDCEKAWEDIRAESPAVSPQLLRKYHNCRIRHRHRLGIKPEKFRPICETYCAHVTREAGTPGLPSNPLKWLFCIGELFKKDEEEEDGDGGGDSTSQSASASTDIDTTQTQTQENFQDYKPKEIPEGYGNYY